MSTSLPHPWSPYPSPQKWPDLSTTLKRSLSFLALSRTRLTKMDLPEIRTSKVSLCSENSINNLYPSICSKKSSKRKIPTSLFSRLKSKCSICSSTSCIWLIQIYWCPTICVEVWLKSCLLAFHTLESIIGADSEEWRELWCHKESLTQVSIAGCLVKYHAEDCS